MMRKSWFLCICILLAALPLLSAQTAAEIEDLLSIDALSYERAAGFILKAADIPDFSDSEAVPNSKEAFDYALQRKWLPANSLGSEDASLKGISLLMMRSFNVKGGLFYTLFGGSHYAYRELVYKEVIQGRNDGDMQVSGSMLLFMIGRIMTIAGSDTDFDLSGREPAEEVPQIVTAPVPYTSAPSTAAPSTAAPPTAAPPTAPIFIAPLSPQRIAEQQALTEEINSRLASGHVADTSARITNEGITISLSNIQFLANSSELPESEKRKLQEISRIIKDISMRRILVTGHTALAGTAEDRMQTSLDRAKSVAQYLISIGSRNPEDIFVQGMGAERPIADNSTQAGMAANRRVEITILENQQ